MNTIYEINLRLAEIEVERQQLEANLLNIKSTPIDKQLAEILHSKCIHNHIDQCGWDYERDWDGSTHKRYLEKSHTLLKKLSKFNLKDDDLIELCQIVLGT